MIASWTCPLPGAQASGGTCEELVLKIGIGAADESSNESDAAARPRILIIPPLFSEHNLMRRQLAEVMRRLAGGGAACVLPDLPGWNESLQPLENQTLAGWRSALAAAIAHFEATHVLAVRSGALVIPAQARGWAYAAQDGAKLLRGMIRARTIASKEAGTNETSEALFALGREEGVTLNGWPIGAALFRALETAQTPVSETIAVIDQSLVGGAGLWLRAEPDEDAQQAGALATAVLEDLGTPE